MLHQQCHLQHRKTKIIVVDVQQERTGETPVLIHVEAVERAFVCLFVFCKEQSFKKISSAISTKAKWRTYILTTWKHDKAARIWRRLSVHMPEQCPFCEFPLAGRQTGRQTERIKVSSYHSAVLLPSGSCCRTLYWHTTQMLKSSKTDNLHKRKDLSRWAPKNGVNISVSD